MAISVMGQKSGLKQTKTNSSNQGNETQRFLEFYDSELPTRSGRFPRRAALRSRPIEDQYASVKRVSLVYEGSLRERPCISSSHDAISFFKRYWQQAPANDQEKFVVACLDVILRLKQYHLFAPQTVPLPPF